MTGKEPPRQGVGGSVPSVVLEMHEGEESLHIPNGRGEPSNHAASSGPVSSGPVVATLPSDPAWPVLPNGCGETSNRNFTEESCVTNSHSRSHSSERQHKYYDYSSEGSANVPHFVLNYFGKYFVTNSPGLLNTSNTHPLHILGSCCSHNLCLGQLCNQSEIMSNIHWILPVRQYSPVKSQKRFICSDYILQIHYIVSNCFERNLVLVTNIQFFLNTDIKHPLHILGSFCNGKLLISPHVWQYGIHNNKLLELSKSVCQVRTRNGFGIGSGFLLFKNFILTNFHVIKPYYDFKTGQLTNGVAVTFSHEIQESECDLINVVGVHCYEFCNNFGNKSDWVLLEIDDSMPLPNGLLPHIKSVSDTEYSNIFIIGHPNVEVKQVDVCSIVCPENRRQVVEENWRKNPGSDDRINLVVKEIPGLNGRLTYNSNFYQGSSGSPVFNEEGSLIAMHSGGYFYRDAKGQPHSLIDFSYPLSSIIKQIELQMV
ncbi:uncharacterized protein LOC102195373 [Pundamilia nyererei]|uniref:Uncharacterized protein LOC102195373 n=1 Tax=Pundamilia nyererei TaxID=303518 RepID=A0A9Y3QW54_9CICH|nr:PREDICTED: uncharacterized protein LOC102195373 [Pundamilia nyererei]XP_005727937.1 PREDICTED: uncharacterized protein LOC102195373 [Pundamilia nyererei]XP_005727938.1 PREDICTED: uncharacterized protein LOC102195373 [Pundamilia nyererei]XP_005727939.1 PREDICTED: uncharacterized protein LOC102195373 [Pundamilia nyererei]